ncbi:plasmid partitioning protein RepB C-terminal domain-containing protein [Ferrovibrio sp.]|uniref:plasmid partitioning protein RepB C-terminal domain-containing protein n=1 Tax=Ferrovibrio sp. TaxID=1917215 RepID=UPI000CC5B5FA|nr:plasmid partitioning protein RepB C-terminal domain-containing protein [Ferrovibrio sp.]PJI42242.1 MAG: chromosome partitioning protein ParB [Ferrovibrio sp.]
MQPDQVPQVEMVPIDRITVVNPRVRNRKVFREITDNIAQLGLKRPVTVIRRDNGDRYDLVCGQGRLEAYQALGQVEIPALIVEAGEEDSLVMSLVENLARRQHRAIDLLRDISGLKQRGYSEYEIATKTGLTLEYAKGVLKLLENGETRLLRSVETGLIPVSVAVSIADTDDAGVQDILQKAYESRQLRGRRLLMAKRLIESRRRRGKGLRGSYHRTGLVTSDALLRAYRDDAEKKRLLVRKAEATRDRLVFMTEAIRKLFADENFVTLLRAEGLDTLPKNLADRLLGGKGLWNA